MVLSLLSIYLFYGTNAFYCYSISSQLFLTTSFLYAVFYTYLVHEVLQSTFKCSRKGEKKTSWKNAMYILP